MKRNHITVSDLIRDTWTIAVTIPILVVGLVSTTLLASHFFPALFPPSFSAWLSCSGIIAFTANTFLNIWILLIIVNVTIKGVIFMIRQAISKKDINYKYGKFAIAELKIQNKEEE
ncbi:hypothetical protein AZH90_004350 [Salmonella enterica subsp. enterica serovar Legon]|nr:hypothetical protein [Salmonella enterica subsp. enterica serovar Legon]EDW9825494.1 hypothetical protein [Salmonella enterica]EDZ3589485.1 hypothetical protein [Salmonella enterica subsp. enterica serovar Wagenia]EHL5833752.1 hypothetical protein [Salmonella enterica]